MCLIYFTYHGGLKGHALSYKCLKLIFAYGIGSLLIFLYNRDSIKGVALADSEEAELYSGWVQWAVRSKYQDLNSVFITHKLEFGQIVQPLILSVLVCKMG